MRVIVRSITSSYLLLFLLSSGRPSVGHTGRRWGEHEELLPLASSGGAVMGESAKLTRRLDLPRVQAAAKARDAPLTSGPQAVNSTNWPEMSRPAAPARPIRASAGERITPAEEADLCRGVPGNHDAAGVSDRPRDTSRTCTRGSGRGARLRGCALHALSFPALCHRLWVGGFFVYPSPVLPHLAAAKMAAVHV